MRRGNPLPLRIMLALDSDYNLHVHVSDVCPTSATLTRSFYFKKRFENAATSPKSSAVRLAEPAVPAATVPFPTLPDVLLHRRDEATMTFLPSELTSASRKGASRSQCTLEQ